MARATCASFGRSGRRDRPGRQCDDRPPSPWSPDTARPPPEPPALLLAWELKQAPSCGRPPTHQRRRRRSTSVMSSNRLVDHLRRPPSSDGTQQADRPGAVGWSCAGGSCPRRRLAPSVGRAGTSSCSPMPLWHPPGPSLRDADRSPPGWRVLKARQDCGEGIPHIALIRDTEAALFIHASPGGPT